MIHSISWGAYWTTIALLTAIYYTGLLAVHFLHDRKHTVGAVPYLPAKEQEALSQAPQIEEHYAYTCIDELNAFFEEAKKRHWKKGELHYALQSLLQNYTSLHDTRYRDAVTNVLATQCESVCHIHFSAEELRQVWMKK